MRHTPATSSLRLTLAIILCAFVPVVRATLLQFDLVGTAGSGLLPGNQNPAVAGGTGGELGSGITFDDVSKVLTINVGWGSTNGFIDLSSATTAAHIHGPTLSTAPASYTENAGVLIGLMINSGSAQGSTITQTATLTGPQETALMAGQLYLNVHTVNNGGGEIRGNLIPSATVLALDFNDRSFAPTTNTQNGFTSFLIASNVSATAIQTGALARTYGTYTVTVSGSGANPGYDDRQRGTPVNGGSLTQGQLYRDFIFSPDTGTGGLNVTVDGLVPNQTYLITCWSFDQGTSGGRLSDWTANGTLMVDNYFFNGATLPTTDTQNQFTFKIRASLSGQIAIQGRRDSGSPAGIAVFLNALKMETTTPDAPTIVASPTPLDIYAGDNPMFTAIIGGTAPFDYQWRKNGSSIPGATNASFSLTNAQSADAALYSVIAANSSGTATSGPAALIVRTVTNIASGLIAYWPLDDLSVTTPDLSGYYQTLNATNMDGSNLVSGQRGNAVFLNGSDEFLTRTNELTNALPAYAYPAYTVAMWVRGYYTNQLDRRVWNESSNTNNNSLMTLGTDSAGTNGNVDIFIRNNNGTNPHNHKKSSLLAFDGAWHHIAWVDNNGAAKLYVDGVLDPTDFSYVRGVLTANIASLGVVYRTNSTALFNGSLDDAVVWRRALSQPEVQRAMSSGPSPITFIVTTANDSGPGSLRAVLESAQPGDTVAFTQSLNAATISLLSGLPTSFAAPGVTIDATMLTNGITITSGPQFFRPISLTNGNSLTLRGLTFANCGSGTFSGAAIINGGGTLTLEDCRLTGNLGSGGGAIRNSSGGNLSLARCTLSSNVADVAGAILAISGSLTLTDCNLYGNAATNNGGAIVSLSPTVLTLTRCTFATNVSLSGGAVVSSGSATLMDCTFSGNTTDLPDREGGSGGAVIFNSGSDSLTRCVFSGNSGFDGGAIQALNSVLALTNCTFTGNYSIDGSGGAIEKNAGVLWMTGCTLSGNVATSTSGGGGALNNHQGVAVLTYCTLTGNLADGSFPNAGGGAIRNSDESELTLDHCTISLNTARHNGGGINNHNSPAIVTLSNTIVAGNSLLPGGLGTGADIFNGVTNVFAGANLVQGYAGDLFSGPAPINANPLLAPLGDYGGPTMTMALLPGSPARNAAVDSTSTGDQRGLPIVGVPDIGAYEAGTPANFNAFIWESLPTTNGPAHNAGVDYDGDGVSNYDEWLALTDPANAASTLRIVSIAPDNGTNVLIHFPTVPGRTYTLWSASIVTDTFTNTGLPALAGSGDPLTFTNNVGAIPPQRFYKLQAGP